MQTGAEDEKAVTDKRIDKIIKRMVAINTSLRSIEVYQRNDPGLQESTYNPIGKAIVSFFDYINGDAVSGLSGQLIQAVYEGVFDKIGRCELLFVAQDLYKKDGNIDADMLLVCANRADRTGSFLFLCDTAFIGNIQGTKALIPTVFNLGILHHYVPKNPDVKHLQAGKDQEGKLSAEQTAEEYVLDKIPSLIKENIKNTNLKVVLRCCKGGQQAHLQLQDSQQQLKQLTNVYPLGLLPAQPVILQVAKTIHSALSFDSDAQFRKAIFEGACAKNDKILVRQDVSGRTEIFLPNMSSTMCRYDFPILKVIKRSTLNEADKQNFSEFSNQLIRLLNDHFIESSTPLFIESSTPLYIDPYQVSLVAGGACYEHKELWNQGVNLVKTSFESLLKKWEKPSLSLPKEAPQGLSFGKKDLQRFFAPANSLKDKMCIHKGTYAGKLLAAIKGKYVDVFKTYYGGYNAYKDRMVQEANKRDISDPKSIIVTRASNYMVPLSEDELKDESSLKGAGGGPKP